LIRNKEYTIKKMSGKERTKENKETVKKSGRNEITVGANDRTAHILEVQKLHD
jgi:hypothetical protein